MNKYEWITCTCVGAKRAISWREQMIIESRREQMIIDFDEMIMVSYLYQTNELLLDLLSLKQQSAGRHAAPLGHIIPIPIQPMFTLSP